MRKVKSPHMLDVEVPFATHDRIALAQEFAALPDEGLATTGQTAAFLNCSDSKLERDRWVGDGIPFVQLGRAIRYQKSVVMAHVSGATRVSTSAAGGL